MSDFKNVAAIVLAAGEATRFNQGKPAPFQKVLQKIHGKPMIDYTVELLKKLNLGRIIIVIGHHGDNVKKHLGKSFTYAVQSKRLGTLDAAVTGLAKVNQNCHAVLVVNGDDSFRYRPKTLAEVLIQRLNTGSVLTFISLEVKNPQGLGRIVRDSQNKVVAVVEEKDANEKQRKIKEINDGIYVFDKSWLAKNTSKVKKSPVTGEFYIVDLVKIAANQGDQVETYKLKDSSEWFGVNTPQELVLANQ